MKTKFFKTGVSVGIMTSFACLSSISANEHIKLDEVVVTATKTSVKSSEVPASVDIVYFEDIDLLPNTTNAFKAISNLAGVEVSSGGMADKVTIRGNEPSLLINGRDMNFFSSGSYSPKVGMNSIESIEVIKGPQAAIHGSKAVSGVVNIIRKKGDINNPYIELEQSLSSGDEYITNLSWGGGRKRSLIFS